MTAFYIKEQLGKQQGLTPEGFLIIQDVPLARTGLQLYSENEVPVKGGADGLVYIMRDEEEVFRPETILSLQGKPISLDHPSEDITPANYRELAVGHVINPRRGLNHLDHLLLGDLVVWDPDVIESVRNKSLLEVSVGYDADYEDTGGGRGRQRNILANHLALVKDGRCGAVCRIGDRATVPFHATRDACTCAACSTTDTDIPTTSAERAKEGSAPRFSVELLALDGANRFFDFWRYLKKAASSGHSFMVEADRDEHLSEFWPYDGHPSFFLDGDGADRLGRMYLDDKDITDQKTADAEWHEEDHPRGQPGNAGQFASSAGGGGKKTRPAAEPSKSKQPGAKPKTEYEVAPEHHREANHSIYNYLSMTNDHFGHMVPPGMETKEALLQKHGVPFIANDRTYAGKRGPAGACFMNATREVIHHADRTYVEGYITVHGVPIHHAWTVDETGQIYDPTVPPGTAVTGYFGIPFSTEYVVRSSLKNMTYGILHHNETIGDLLSGKEKDYKAKLDISKLSDDHIAERLAFADKVLHSLEHTNNINTPERTAMREKIVDKLYNHNIKNRSRNRTATIIFGFPGSGKSTFANPLLDGGALEIDNDNAKALIPEFRGGLGAGATHKEASAITRTVLQKAITNGDDFVWPRVDSPEDITRDLTNLKKAGYKVNIVLVRVPPDVAKESVITRYLSTGRYVPPAVVDEYGAGVEEAYREAKKLADRSEVYSRGRTGGFTKVEGPGSGN